MFVPLTRWRPGDANTPADTSRESPGRKNPISRPVSAKIMPITPSSPMLAIRWLGLTAGHGTGGGGLTADASRAQGGRHYAQVSSHRGEPGQGPDDLQVPRIRLRGRGLLRSRP